MRKCGRWEKRVLAVAAGLLLLAGCSGGLNSSLVSVSGSISSPMFEKPPVLPVIHPSPAGGPRGADLMVQTHGPAWRGIEAEYPEYRFNN